MWWNQLVFLFAERAFPVFTSDLDVIPFGRFVWFI